MDPKLLALPHIDGDLARINLDPASADAIRRRYGKAAS
jgi:alkane 1-monooxygenase